MPISLRDPSGQIHFVDGRVIRFVNEQGQSDLDAFFRSNASREFFDSQKVVKTFYLEDEDFAELLKLKEFIFSNDESVALEHERIPFVTYPYEWSPEMLYAAAELTLDMAEKLIDEDLGLKDATPYNVLFRGSEAVFVDLLSFEKRDANDPTWLPYAQFVRTFLLPLLLHKHFGIRLDKIFTSQRDGVEPEEAYRFCSMTQKLSPSFFSLVTLPFLLNGKSEKNQSAIYQKHSLKNPEQAKFILRRLLSGLRRQLRRAEPSSQKNSTWSDYTNKNQYSADYQPQKQAFVKDSLAQFKPKSVLDVGCNTGEFSVIAAQSGASVVSIDYDDAVVGKLWQRAKNEGLDILPLVVNLARPTPAIGWRNIECQSFLERAKNNFDAVLMLAVIHHLLVSEQIPLEQIMEVASEMTKEVLVIEYVAPTDAMFKRITRGRDHLYSHLTLEHFKSVCGKHFDIIKQEKLKNTDRSMFLLRKKGVSSNA